MAAERVLLRHSETGGEWECPARAVDGWREKGWEPASPEPTVTTTTSARRRGATAEETNTNG